MIFRLRRYLVAALCSLGIFAAQFAGAQTPMVSGVSITSSPVSGDTYELAEEIHVQVTFDRAVDVTGRPQLTLTVGSTTRQAGYAGSPGGTTYGFSYVVRSSDSDSNGVSVGASALALNGGTIKIRGGTTDATLSLGTHAIANSANHKVDGSRATAPTVNNVAVRAPESGDTFGLAETIMVFVYFDRSIDVTGTPQVALTIGSATRQAGYDQAYSNTADTALLLRYTVQSSDRDMDGISIGAGTLAGLDTIETDPTAGAVSRPPSTLWFGEFEIAKPRPKEALATPPLVLTVPPFNVRALAPTLTPSTSTSAAWTTYWNVRFRVIAWPKKRACRIVEPIVKASCGPPLTSTAWVKLTLTSITSPNS